MLSGWESFGVEVHETSVTSGSQDHQIQSNVVAGGLRLLATVRPFLRHGLLLSSRRKPTPGNLSSSESLPHHEFWEFHWFLLLWNYLVSYGTPPAQSSDRAYILFTTLIKPLRVEPPAGSLRPAIPTNEQTGWIQWLCRSHPGHLQWWMLFCPLRTGPDWFPSSISSSAFNGVRLRVFHKRECDDSGIRFSRLYREQDVTLCAAEARMIRLVSHPARTPLTIFLSAFLRCSARVDLSIFSSLAMSSEETFLGTS